MRPKAMLCAGILLFVAGAGVAAQTAQVIVIFKDPALYIDAGPLAGVDPSQDRNLVALQRHLERLGQRYLTSGQVLRVEFLDIDLAGSLATWRPATAELRIMSEVTWPSMRLRYSLEDDGKIVASAEERLVKLDYLGDLTDYRASDPLRFDKVLLDDWFDRHFARHSGRAEP
jgi:Protein of unknown function (DUF3016)